MPASAPSIATQPRRDALPPGPLPDAGGARVILLTRTGCHLCEDAAAVVSAVTAERGVAHRLVDVDSDPQLRAAWNDHVPVTVVDGRVVAIWMVTAAQVHGALDSGSNGAAARRAQPGTLQHPHSTTVPDPGGAPA